ncbi:hypothetical protein C1752_14782 [Acaryochloris thomasi RCC1774]|uniref:Uncharacterized protein n=1 Tax=Acaryochloris thomasi RCC1774 TaxID=1764569 RepID=A0A2W1JMZ2_9CYAN|nr:hypothetical protein [Acaryochloris thomasi]PZD70277.1 hypothetical protein C1752_14782 [Acaryochloris thomasi RCC1774]
MFEYSPLTSDQLLYVEPSEYIGQSKTVWRNHHNRKLFLSLCLVAFITLIYLVLPHEATAQGPIDVIIEAGTAVQEAVSDSVEDIWEDQLPLFMTLLSQLSVAIAVISIIVLGMELVQEQIDWGYFTWQRAVIPLVMMGVISQITFMADVAYGLRNEFNQLSTNAYETFGILETIGEAGDADALPNVLSSIFEECNKETVVDSRACAEDAIEQSEAILDIEERNYPGAGWIAFYRNRIEEFSSNILDDGFSLSTIPEVFRDISLSFVQNQITGLFLFISTGLQGAIQILFEVVLFVTSLLLPLAVARSISEGFGPLVAWFLKMFEFALVKFLYTILIGISSLIYINAGGIGGGIWFTMLVGFLAPLLAFGMLAGGGLSVVQGIIGAAGSVAGVAVKVARAI